MPAVICKAYHCVTVVKYKKPPFIFGGISSYSICLNTTVINDDMHCLTLAFI